MKLAKYLGKLDLPVPDKPSKMTNLVVAKLLMNSLMILISKYKPLEAR